MCAPMVCMFPCTRVHVQTCLIYQSSYSVIYLSIHIGPFANSKCWPAYLVRAGEYRRIPPSVHQLACFFPSHSMSLQAMACLRRKMPSGRSIPAAEFGMPNVHALDLHPVGTQRGHAIGALIGKSRPRYGLLAHKTPFLDVTIQNLGVDLGIEPADAALTSYLLTPGGEAQADQGQVKSGFEFSASPPGLKIPQRTVLPVSEVLQERTSTEAPSHRFIA